MEPFVALMRRYCIDYTSVHDLSVCDDIMADDYAVTISGRTLEMDDYRGAVTAAFRRYPTLVLTVHELMLSGDRLAMRFSEHGAAADDPDHVAVWPGLSLYRWDGQRLRTCRVEQDFVARDEQTASGLTAPLEPPHPDPWATTRDLAGDTACETAVRRWVDELTADPVAALRAPGVRVLESTQPTAILADQRLRIDDLFSAGSRVAAAITLSGIYAGGLTGVDDTLIGTPGELPATLIADVGDGRVTGVRMVRDRWGLARRLRTAARG